MQVNQSDLEAVWREAWIEAPEGAATFYERLTAKWRDCRALNTGGSLSSISQNSSSHSYANPGANTLTTVDKERICLESLRLYERLQADLNVLQDVAGELAIYNEGLARFKPEAGESFHDFSCARLPIA